MPRKSSIMAKLAEYATSLTGMVKEAQEEMAGYMEDAEKYRELKPMLNKITNRIGQETTAPLISEETTGHHDGGDDTQNTNGQDIPATDKKRRGRKASGENTNTEPPNG